MCLRPSASQALHGRRARLIEIHPHGLMSAEHGQTQQAVSELLLEYLPDLASDGIPTVVLLDEVESMAVARSAASLSAPSPPVLTGHSFRPRRSACRESRRPVWMRERGRMSSALSSEPEASARRARE